MEVGFICLDEFKVQKEDVGLPRLATGFGGFVVFRVPQELSLVWSVMTSTPIARFLRFVSYPASVLSTEGLFDQ